MWCPHPWGHGPQFARGRAVTGLWWARVPTSLRHSPAEISVSEGGSSPPGVSVYFEDGFAVQPFTHTPCGVRGCGGVLQFVPRRFFGVRPPIMPLRLSEAEGGFLLPFASTSPPIGSIISGRLALHAYGSPAKLCPPSVKQRTDALAACESLPERSGWGRASATLIAVSCYLLSSQVSCRTAPQP